MELVISKKQLDDIQCRASPPLVLGSEQVLMKVERFAITSNNVTYAVAGNTIGYFNFFPCLSATGEPDAEHAIVPVWGIGTVVASRSEDVKEGDKFYGYFPMASYFVMTPKALNAQSVIDTAEHRASLPAIYNQYMRCSEDPLYKAEDEAFMCINRPLYLTSWILDDFLADNDYFGAEGIVLASASSKTALGVAWELKANKSKAKVIGLTSPRNVEYVNSLGIYDQVVAYPDIESTDFILKTAVYVDMSGNQNVARAIHSKYEDNLKYSCAVGKTHWNSEDKTEALKGPKQIMFFAPSQFEKRTKEWGAQKMGANMAKSWFRYVKQSLGNKWCQVNESYGSEESIKVYKMFTEGSVDPQKGFICSMWDPSKL